MNVGLKQYVTFSWGWDSALDMDDKLHKNDNGPSCMGSQPCMGPQSTTLHGV